MTFNTVAFSSIAIGEKALEHNDIRQNYIQHDDICQNGI